MLTLYFSTTSQKRSGAGIVGNALEHDAGGAVAQRAVDDVAVAGDPADVGGAPVDVVLMIVEDHLVGHGGIEQVTAGGVHDALGLAGGAGGVEDEERIFGVHLLGRAVVREPSPSLLRTRCPRPLLMVDLGAGALDDDASSRRGQSLIGAVGVGLLRNGLGAAEGAVAGDEQL